MLNVQPSTMSADHAIDHALHSRLLKPHVHEPACRLVDRLGRRIGIRRHNALGLVLATVNALRDVLLAEDLLCVHPIVRAAAHAKIRGVVRAAVCAWHYVIELEEGLALATPTPFV